MVQNVFTFCKPIALCENEVALNFTNEITQLNDEGWIVKQISTTSFEKCGNKFYSISVLAEKSE